MRRPSLTSVVIKSIDERYVRKLLDQYAATLLASNPLVEEIVVFGSFEKGTYAPGSDVDIAVVLTQSAKPPRDRVPELLPSTFPLGIDLFPYTREELGRPSLSWLAREMARSTWRYSRADLGPTDR